MRKLLGVLVAVVALGGGAFGTRQVDASRDRSIRAEVGRAAEAAGQRAMDGLTSIVSDLKQKVENAASNPRLVFALQGNVDERTMRDLWRTEEWWRPWRTEFKVYAVSMDGTRLDVVEGIGAPDLDARALLQHTSTSGEATTEVIVGKNWPYAATATAVRVPGRERPPLLVLAKPVDQAMLGRLAEKTASAMTLTDGKRSLIDAGPEADRALLAQAIGSERSGAMFHAPDGTFHAPDGSWAAKATAIAPGLWLWTFASAAAAAHDAATAADERKLMMWGMAGLVAVVALFLALRRPRTVAMLPDGTLVGLPAAGGFPVPATFGNARPPVTQQGPPGGFGPVDIAAATALQATPPRPQPVANASAFGRYTLLDRLGEGGMAEVYTAVTFGAEGFRRKFVIKRLRAELARDSAAVAQFIDEANLASSMVHSNIVPVFDFGKVGDEYFLAQEYILGRDLARLTRRAIEREGRALSTEAVVYIALETLKGLEYAHTKTGETGQPLGIVHRDVSPSNVIVSARGEVKLFDFGIVKAEGRVTKTQSGVVKGNVTFMSPEQARGADVDARADLFSMGLVIYYCLTGQVLYSGNTTYELLVKAATGPGPQELSAIRALPDPWADLLQRALEIRPADRFQSAREFADAIAARVGGGAAALAALMNHLFAEDFRGEEARFRASGPSGAGGGAGAGAAPATGETAPRRS